jgi:tetratricopeptide (TPR) repeat protein
MATLNSHKLGPPFESRALRSRPREAGQRPARWLALTLQLVLFALVGAAVAPAPEAFAESPTERVARIYAESQARFRRETNNSGAAWEFGRACFDLADLATNNTQRAELAQQGIEACRLAVARDPKSAAAHYYLGLNLGQWAQAKKFSALPTLGEMESAWKTAIAIDPKYDFAGAHHSLGLMYRDAPGWPISLGNRDKARFHLQKAVELSPEYPSNQLNWLETLLAWGDKKAVQAKIPSVEAVLSAARHKLTGDEWVLAWQDWDSRWQRIKAKANAQSLKSPREKG